MIVARRWVSRTAFAMAIVIAATRVSHDASAAGAPGGAGGASAARRLRPDPAGKPRVESFALIAVDTLNARIAVAARAGELWTRDPIRVALEVAGASPLSARMLDIHCEGNRGEEPDSAEVTLVGDGYLDDSVRGSWSALRLARKPDATWRVLELRRAWRCWRGHHLESYSNRPCP